MHVHGLAEKRLHALLDLESPQPRCDQTHQPSLALALGGLVLCLLLLALVIAL